jgi:flagellar hook protein FlgE
MRRLTCDPKSEVQGGVLAALTSNLQTEAIAPYLAQFNMDHIDPDEWYPTKNYLDLLNELGEKENLTTNFVAIGMTVAETAYMPPEMEGLPFSEFVLGWNDHYYANHRNADIGSKIVEKVGDRHYQIIMDSIYPDDMEYGILYGFAKRYLPAGTDFTVWYDEDVQRKDHGGEETVVHVSWD